ncbi:IS4 family transposase, partial [Pedobacter alpinus]|uniref:IS4 family transposase n=1 Tax=Pedobacter alpinus TaxID=1590643 RepID=UPI0036716A75
MSLLFGQLNKCLSLREITMGLGLTPETIKDIGLLQSPAKSTMSDGNAKRNYCVFELLYKELIKHYRTVYSKTPGYKAIDEIKGRNIKIIDSTIMSVSLNLFNWAKFRTAKGGIKAHVSLDEAMMLPEMVHITEAGVSDRRGADNFRYEADTIVVDDRGYFDFNLFKQRITDENHFVTRIKDNTVYESVIEKELNDENSDAIIKDEIILLTSAKASEAGLSEVRLRRTAVYIEKDDRTVVLITNQLDWSADTIAELYKRRWNIETFFKLIKQNLQIKTFVGINENACKSQLFVGLIAYFLLELIRRVISKVRHRFGHFATLIRICLMHYTGLDYVVNEIKDVVKKARKS